MGNMNHLGTLKNKQTNKQTKKTDADAKGLDGAQVICLTDSQVVSMLWSLNVFMQKMLEQYFQVGMVLNLPNASAL